MKEFMLVLFMFPIGLVNGQFINEPIEEKECHLNQNSTREAIVLCDSIYSHGQSGFNYERTYNLYNEFGLITLRETYKINENSEWIIQRRNTYIYDENGMVIEYLDQLISIYTNEFQNYRYHYHTFNENDLMIEDLIQDWDWVENIWRDKWKSNYQYNDDENVTEILTKIWNKELELWENNGWELYSYDDDKNLIEEVRQYWDNEYSTYVNNTKYSYSFSEGGNMTEEIRSTWSIDDQQWKDVYLSEFGYDSEGFLITETQSIKENDPSVWVTDRRYLFTNDYMGNVEERLTQYWDPYDSIWSDWDNRFYYNSIHQTTGIPLANENTSFLFYPNPTSDVINIKLGKTDASEIQLFNTMGQLVGTEKVNGNLATTDISALPKGIYLLHVCSIERILAVKKIIKE